MDARINRDDLDVTPDSVLVLQNAGPLGGPGMPEWGMLPIPQKLLPTGRARYGADFRCAHERHGVWNVRSACFAGELCRWSAGAGGGWRSDLARCREATLDLLVSEEEMARGAQRGRSPRRDTNAVMWRSTRARDTGASRAAISISSMEISKLRSPKFTNEIHSKKLSRIGSYLSPPRARVTGAHP